MFLPFFPARLARPPYSAWLEDGPERLATRLPLEGTSGQVAGRRKGNKILIIV